jgi:hypothetical protein
MGWLDDLATRAQQAAQERLGDIGSNITSYIEGQIAGADPTVKVGAAPTGNLSAAQIAAGQRGGTAPTAAAAAPASASQNAGVAGMLGGFDAQKLLPVVAIGALAFIMFSRRRRS